MKNMRTGVNSVKLAVFGDFRAADPSKIKFDKEVADLLKSVDFNVCNFEAPIHTDNNKPIKKSGPVLDQSADSPTFLMNHGFNVILMANNHIMDYGRKGSEATIKAFNGITIVGVGEARDAFSVRFVDVKGKRIGFCSLVQKEFGTVDTKDGNDYGAAWINSLDVPDVIKEAKGQCDYLLVLPHAGVEHTAAPLPEWRRLYKYFIRWGADAVIASHPHCPQGWETYQGKPIYYSLGDFYFDELTYNDLWYKNIAVEFIIGETVEIKEHFLYFNDKTGEVGIDNSDRMSNYMKYANELLQNDEEYKKYINSMCAGHWPGIKYGLLRGVCGVSMKMRIKYIFRLLGCMLIGNRDEMYLLNAFQNESHRWVVERYFKKKNGIIH